MLPNNVGRQYTLATQAILRLVNIYHTGPCLGNLLQTYESSTILLLNYFVSQRNRKTAPKGAAYPFRYLHSRTLYYLCQQQ